jgi:hypothetical protein
LAAFEFLTVMTDDYEDVFWDVKPFKLVRLRHLQESTAVACFWSLLAWIIFRQ